MDPASGLLNYFITMLYRNVMIKAMYKLGKLHTNRFLNAINLIDSGTTQSMLVTPGFLSSFLNSWLYL